MTELAALEDRRSERLAYQHQANACGEANEETQSHAAAQRCHESIRVVRFARKCREDGRSNCYAEYAEREFVEALAVAQDSHAARRKRIFHAKDGGSNHRLIASNQAIDKGIHLEDAKTQEHGECFVKHFLHVRPTWLHVKVRSNAVVTE